MAKSGRYDTPLDVSTGGYDYVINASRRDLAATGRLGETNRTDIGRSRRDDLRATGHYGETRRTDIGRSYGHDLRATGHYGETHRTDIGRTRRDDTDEDIDFDWVDDLPNPDVLNAYKTDALGRTLHANASTNHRESRPQRVDESTRHKFHGSQWVSMANDKESMDDMHAMFGRVKTKFDPTISYRSDPTLPHMPIVNHDNSYRSMSTGSTSIISKDTQRRNRIRWILVIAVVIALIVAAVIPTVVILTAKADERNELRQYTLELILPDETYEAFMGVPTSEAYKNFEKQYCDEVLRSMAASRLQTGVRGCVIDELTKGSVVVKFTIVVIIETHTTTAEIVAVITQNSTETKITMGVFVVETESVKVVSVVTIAQTANPTPQVTANPFGGTCTLATNCKTLGAVCTQNKCSCQDIKYQHNTTLDDCLKIDCGAPPTISNGQATHTGTGYLDIFKVTCNTGHELTVDGNVTCQQNRSWTGVVPSCNPVQCTPLLDTLEHVLLNSSTNNSNKFNESSTIACEDGYELQGNDVVKCFANKSWSEIPSCLAITCTDYSPPDNAIVNVTNGDSFNETKQIACNDGYTLEGQDTVTCTADKTWSQSGDCLPVTCPQYQVPTNANKTITVLPTYVYNQFISLSCDDGYELMGEAKVKCQANATWSPSPECIAKNCATFTQPDHASINESAENGNSFGESKYLVCDDGYTMEGSNKVDCTSDGTWSDSPSCNPVSCNTFDPPTNAEIKTNAANGNLFGEKSYITCVDGYDINGNDFATCQADSTWNGIGTCEAKTCNEFVLPDNAKLKDSSSVGNSFNEEKHIACNSGYEMTGPDVVRCLANASWSQSPSCDPVSCNTFDPPTNAEIKTNAANGNMFGEKTYIICVDGYDINGNDFATCQADSTWTGIGTCEAKTCNEFVLPDHATLKDSSSAGNSFNEEKHIACNSGYEMTGPDVVRCLANASWSQSPSCDPVSCNTFDPPTNAEIKTNAANGNLFGEKTYITCVDGYDINGNDFATCQADSTWNEIGTCEAKTCNEFVLPDNASIVGNNIDKSNIKYGMIIELQCEDGYILVGMNNFSCNTDGTWKEVTCTKSSCDTSLFPKHISIFNTTSNQAVTVQCDEGYTLQGNASLTCTNGNWSEIPTCNIKNCGNYEPPPNAEVANTSGTLFGDTAYVKCKTGYKIEDVSEVKCSKDGSWKPLAKCLIKDCGNYTLPANSFHTGDRGGNTYGENITITCDVGYTSIGETVVTCTDTEQWSKGPDCLPVDCGSIDEIANGNVEYKGTTTLNQTATVVCNNGYTPEGNAPIVCEANGDWSAIPECKIVSCGTPESPSNGKSALDGTTFNSHANVSCNDGFSLIGESMIHCQADGTWEDAPICRKLSCGDYIPPEHSDANVNIDNVTLDITCHVGYILSGLSTVTCLSNGTWQSSNASCNRIECTLFDTPADGAIDTSDASGNRFGDTTKVICNDGYEADGSLEALCLANGSWNNIPSCKQWECHNFDEPNNTVIDTSMSVGTKYAENITLKCKEGYTSTETLVATCKADKTWTDVPACQLQECDQLENPDNTKVDDTMPIGGKYGENITLKCIDGYTTNETLVATCKADKTWTDVPSCQLQECENFKNPDNTRVDDTMPNGGKYGENITLKCIDGYTTTETLVATCKADKTWTDVPACQLQECENFENPDNTRVDDTMPTGGKFGENITLKCVDGYTTNETLVATCKADKTWTDVSACQLQECENFEIPDNTKVDDTMPIGGKFGENITLKCVDGYTTTETLVATCKADKTWTDVPACQLQECENFEIPDNTRVDDTMPIGGKFGENITLKCVDGYTTTETLVATCKADKTWTDVPACQLQECENFEIPDNTRVDDTMPIGGKFGENITLKCIDGYTTNETLVATCKADKTWTDVPACQLQECENFEIPDNTRVDDTMPIGGKFGENITLKCIDGYTTNETLTAICQANKTWTQVPPCRLQACDSFSTPDNTVIDDKLPIGSKHGENITFQCITGYETNGTLVAICQANQTWSHVPPCNAIECPMFETPNNAEIDSPEPYGTKVGDNITLRCHPGYTSNSSMVATCLVNKTWSNSPDCSRVKCPEPHIANGIVTNANIAGYFFQDTISIKCDANYSLIGKSSVICQANATWQTLPECVKLQCETYSPPPYSSVANIANDTITVTCDYGYVINGSSLINCTNGLWSKSPECVPVDCGSFNATLANGHIVLESGTTFGENVTVSCNNGFEPKENIILNCLANISWESPPPCTPVDCGEPHIPQNISKVAAPSNTTYNASFPVKCKVGFKPTDTSNITCLETGSWSEYPTCQLIRCAEPLDPENGEFSWTGDPLYNTTAVLTCNTGYNVSGDDMIFCDDTGQWSSNNSSCTIIKCGTFPPIPNGHPESSANSIDFGTNVSVSCDAGYNLTGSNVMTCLVNGSWSAQPNCSAMDCGAPEPPLNGFLPTPPESTLFNTTIYFQCNEGYNTSGDLTMTCMETGKWFAQSICSIKNCSTLISHPDGRIVNQTGSSFGDTAFLECNSNYILTGSNTVFCQANGQWTRTPNCSSIDCGAPTAPPNGAIDDPMETSYNTNTTLHCDFGYEVAGMNNITTTMVRCTESGRWTNASCVPVDCGEPTGVRSHIVGTYNTTYLSVVTFECDEGYSPQGGDSMNVTCRGYKEWSSVPTCTAVGSIQFSSKTYGFNINETGTIRCVVQNAAGWSMLLLYKESTFQDEFSNAVVRINQANGTYTNQTTLAHVTMTSNTLFKTDGATLEVMFSPFMCGDDDVYVCGALIGEQSDDNTNFNLDSATVNVAGPSEDPTINITSQSVTLNETITVTCEGKMGKTTDGTITGQVLLQRKLENDGDYLNVSVTPNHMSDKVDCQILVRNEYTFSVDDTWTNSILRCITIFTDSSIPLFSDTRTLVVSCGDEPSITDGDVTAIDGTKDLNLTCWKGYVLVGMSVITCQNNGTWSHVPSCTAVDCQAPPSVANGMIPTLNQTTFNTTAIVQCATGYNISGNAEITCLSTGNWSTVPTCEPVDCGTYVPANRLLVNGTEHNTTYSSITPLKCEDGYHPVNADDMFVTCNSTGHWHYDLLREPGCTAVGSVAFQFTEYVLARNTNATITCDIENSPNWTQIMIFKESFEHELFSISSTDGIQNNGTNDNVTLAPESVINSTDSATVVIQFSPVSCGHKGRYICGAVIGTDPGDDNSKTHETTLHVTAISEVEPPEVESILYANKQYTIRCRARIGKSGVEEWGGDLEIQLKAEVTNSQRELNRIKGTASYTTVTEGISTSDNKVDCFKEVVAEMQFTANSTWANTSIQCFVKPKSMSTNPVTSANVTVTVVNSHVAFDESMVVLNAGEVGYINCTATNYPGWSTIQILRPDGDSVKVLASIQNDTSGSYTYDGLADSTLSTVSPSGVKIVAKFDPVKCSDINMATGGISEYTCKVEMVDNSVGQAVANVKVQRLPKSPNLDLTSDNIEGKVPWAALPTTCVAVVGYPRGSISMDSNIGGNYHVLENNNDPENGTRAVTYENDTAECNDVATLKYYTTYSQDWQGKHIRCHVRNPDVLGTAEPLTTTRVVSVVPANICDGIAVGDWIMHPFMCYTQLQCIVNGGVNPRDPPKCPTSQCYNETSSKCIDCELVDKCQVVYQPPTIPPPGTPYFYCNDTQHDGTVGDIKIFGCGLRDIAMVTELQVFHRNQELRHDVLESGITGSVTIKDGVSLHIDTEQGKVDLNVTVTCDLEGEFRIRINNVTEKTVALRVTSEYQTPILDSIPATLTAGQRAEISCRGEVGRSEDGNSITSLHIATRSGTNPSYSIYDQGVTTDETQTDCRRNASVTLVFYPGEAWNDVDVKCILRDASDTEVAASTEHRIKLTAPNIVFNVSTTSAFIGDSLMMECKADNMSQLSEIKIARGENKLAVATLTNSSKTSHIDGINIDQANSILKTTNGLLRIDISAAKCGDKGDYYCLTTDGIAVQETNLNIGLKRMPQKPTLKLSIDMIENVAPWADYPTSCIADVGYPISGNISLEADIGSGLVVQNATISGEINHDECRTVQTLKFYNTYTMDWDNALIRCVVSYEDDSGTVQTLTATKSARVISETICDDNNEGDVIPHPFYCYAQLTCTARITPFQLCSNDSLCYDFTASTCVPCESLNKCSAEDYTTTTTTTVAPSTPSIECTSPTSGWAGDSLEIVCTLHNARNIFPSTDDNWMALMLDSVVILSTHKDTPDEPSSNSSRYNLMPGMVVIIEDTTLKMLLDPLSCSHIGWYKLLHRQNNSVDARDEVTLHFLANATAPELTKQPSVYYANQPITITCSGNLGSPKGSTSLVLKYRSSSSGPYTTIDDYQNSLDECMNVARLNWTFTVTTEHQDMEILCQILNDDGLVLNSSIETVSTIVPSDIAFNVSATSAFIGDSLTMECKADGMGQLSEIKIVRGENKLPVATLTNSSKTSHIDGINIDQANSVLKKTNGLLRIDIGAAKCSDKGDYYCLTTDGTAVQEMRVNIGLKRMPQKPTLALSIDMIENIAPWEDYPTSCIADVGYPISGNISLEADIGSGLVVQNATISGEINHDECTTVQTLKFYNTYTMDWDNALIKCVVSYEDVTGTLQTLTATKSARVIPETICDDKTVGDVIPHPFYCYAQLTCTDRITPYQLCSNDSYCYDFTARTCVSCESLNNCSAEDYTTTTTTTVAPSTPSIKCTGPTSGWAGDNLEIICTLHNARNIFPSTDDNWMALMLDSVVILSTHKDTPDETSSNSSRYNLMPGMVVIIEKTTLKMLLNPLSCSHIGWYKLLHRQNNSVDARDEVTLNFLATAPELTKQPAIYYANQPITITCSGNLGSSKGSTKLVLKHRSSSSGQYTTRDDYQNSLNECMNVATLSWTFTVTAEHQGMEILCQILNDEGLMLNSSIETISTIAPAVVSFDAEQTKGIIEDSASITCTVASIGDIDGATISRKSASGQTVPIIEYTTAGLTHHLSSSAYAGSTQATTNGFELILTIASVACEDEGDYKCQSTSTSNDSTITSQAATTLDVTSLPSTPLLTVPGPQPIDRSTRYDIDHISCTGHIGYPTAGELKLKYWDSTANVFQDFSLGTSVAQVGDPAECGHNITIARRQMIFDSTWNATRFRCEVFEDGNDTPIARSGEKTLLLYEATCATVGYYPFPYDCQKYIECHSGGSALRECAEGTCPSFNSTTAACFTCTGCS